MDLWGNTDLIKFVFPLGRAPQRRRLWVKTGKAQLPALPLETGPRWGVRASPTFTGLVQIVIPVIIYCLLLGTYEEEGDGLSKDCQFSRNGLAAAAGGLQ